ncbi:MarR family winged helix-turn-helix transcriptional regulator [Cohnella phaseoli]|uniref:DNA-binding MarR family transcriptional regulator n=1 Tax=Cohnella phaseoli TaxID=456490 RepID=A0A3D9ICM7_9BACL|nr:MarR family transcriptional regulator [Cohnella phaseoli]RED59431.1 DNA-binding MarR family transcriptional regulator [Cohnella phaseoli]
MSTHSDVPSPIDALHLLVRATHALQREMENELTTYPIPYPISAPRLRVLEAVAATGSVRMKELAERLNIKARTVTDFVDALERDGLLLRMPDPTDGRATLIRLTELARNHLNEALAYQAQVASRMLANLPDEERSHLCQLLHKLIEGKDTANMAGPTPGA